MYTLIDDSDSSSYEALNWNLARKHFPQKQKLARTIANGSILMNPNFYSVDSQEDLVYIYIYIYKKSHLTWTRADQHKCLTLHTCINPTPLLFKKKGL